jgi:phosphopantetheinyl transferase
MTPAFLDSSHGVWLKTLAYLVLNVRERETWYAMTTAVPKRRQEWLLGRCAAKDAVRTLLRKRGLDVCAADVEIVTDASGRPRVEGFWKRDTGVEPVVSISHSDGIAAAIAGLGGERLGFDMERSGKDPRDFADIAFTAGEKELLASTGNTPHDEWALRMWCARESLSKALGTGLESGLHSIQFSGINTNAGTLEAKLHGELLRQFPDLAEKSISVTTKVAQGFVSAVVVLP